MDHLSALPPLSWSQQLRSQMQSRPLTALGLFIALAAVLLLLLQSLIMLATGEVTSGVRYGLVGGAAGFAATAIALQDIPEGLAVALAMCAAGFRPSVAVLVAIASGLLEPIGALLGVGLSSGLAIAYPIGLGLAAGAMLFVVSHEVIPETHRNGHQTYATFGLMAGFALMMTLDTALG
ncbi:ZIP family metal transporter [Aeromonas veronii]